MHPYRLARRMLALLLILTTFSVLFSSSPLPASSTQQFTPTPPPQSQAQIIESDDPLVVQEGSWTSQDTPQASGGSYLYSSGSAYDTLTLHFYGSRIEVVYVEHPSFGGFTVEIDGDARRTVFAESKETVFGSRAVFDYLEPAPHTLRIMGIQGTVAIDAFYAIPHTPSADEANAASALSSSVRFIPNMGQFDDEVRFEAQGANGTAYYMDSEVALVLPAPSPDPSVLVEPTLHPDERSTDEYINDVVRMQFEGSTTDPTILPLQRLPGEVNYFIGDVEADWHTNVPIYGAIVYEDLYPGVDVVFDETAGALQGTFSIDGGVDISHIRWRYEGATNVRVDEVSGELVFDVVPNPARTEQTETATPVEHRQPALSAWQTAGDQRSSTPIDLHYTVDKDGTVGFAVQGYNATQPLTIAPLSGGGMMEAAVVEPPSEIGFSSYLGGSSYDDHIRNVAADTNGSMYVVGDMPSTAVSGGIIGYGGYSAFVAKFSNGNTLN